MRAARIVASATLAVGVVALVPTLPAQATGKITICHYPPGNPDNPQTIEIAVAAWDAHQAKHVRDGGHDTEGPCETVPPTTDEPTPTTDETAPPTTVTVDTQVVVPTTGPSESTPTTVTEGSPSTVPSTPTSPPAGTEPPVATSPPSDSSTPGTPTSTDGPSTTVSQGNPTTTAARMTTLPSTGPSPLGEKIAVVAILALVLGGIAVWFTRKRPAAQ